MPATEKTMGPVPVMVLAVLLMLVVGGLGVLNLQGATGEVQTIQLTRHVAIHGGALLVFLVLATVWHRRYGAAFAQGKALDRYERIDTMTREFAGSVNKLFMTVSSAVKEVAAATDDLARDVTRTVAESQIGVEAAARTSASAEAVAHSAQSLASSISDCMEKTSGANIISVQAMKEADATTGRIGRLNEATRKIGDVLKIISTIAGQTNLLALNATIEAARAGEMGKGFAVVAGEVKTLAGQTSKATEDIAQRIAEVQEETAEAVTAIGGIAETIHKLSSIASSVNGVMEQQNDATSSIAQGASDASHSTAEVSAQIRSVSGVAQNSSSVLDRVVSAVNKVYSEAGEMQTCVDTFLKKVEILSKDEDADLSAVPVLAWNDTLCIPHPDVDREHQVLFSLFNKLGNAMRQGETKDVISGVLDELVNYTAVHFAHEERLMQKGQYPNFDAHKKEHEAFVAKALSVRDTYARTGSNAMAIETLEFVRNWLINHIQKTDRAYAPYVKDKRMDA